MEENKTIDQSQLAEDLSSKIYFEMPTHFLVKPLDKIMVTKEFSKPVAKDETPTTDENGVEAIDYDKVETEVKEVESDFKRGVVLKIPHEYKMQFKEEKYQPMDIKIGDIIIYKFGQWFDVLKDTQLVRGFDIVAVETR